MVKYVITFLTAVFITILLCFTHFEHTNNDILPIITMQEPIVVKISESHEDKNRIIPKEKEPPRLPKFSRTKIKSPGAPEISLSMSLPELDLDLSPQLTSDLKAPSPVMKTPEQIGNINKTSGVDNILNAGEVDVPPRIKKYFPPLYPLKAKGRRIEGIVVVRALILPNGLPQRVRVISADPEGFFERAAIDAVQRWTFHPARHKGEKVKVLVDIPLKFNLNN